MSADSEKPNIIGGNWTKYCTVAKSVGRGRPIWTSVVVRARVACALRPVQSGRHILESRCAERCASDAFSTSFRATLIKALTLQKVLPVTTIHFVIPDSVWCLVTSQWHTYSVNSVFHEFVRFVKMSRKSHGCTVNVSRLTAQSKNKNKKNVKKQINERSVFLQPFVSDP